MCLTAATAVRSTGKKPAMMTVTSVGAAPMPNQSTMNGSQATGDTGRSTCMTGFRKSKIFRYQPRNTPSTVPDTTAMTQPAANIERLEAMSSQTSPPASMFRRLTATFSGGGRSASLTPDIAVTAFHSAVNSTNGRMVNSVFPAIFLIALFIIHLQHKVII